MRFNPLDAALLAVLLLGAVRGLWRGLIREAFGFLGLVLGLAAALTQTPLVADAVCRHVELPETAAAALAFVGLFVAVHFVLVVLGFLLDRLLVRRPLRLANRAAGGVFGAAKAAFATAFVLLFVQQFGIFPRLGSMARESRFAPPLTRIAGEVLRNAQPLRPGRRNP